MLCHPGQTVERRRSGIRSALAVKQIPDESAARLSGMPLYIFVFFVFFVV
jgi:hypothetical protein